MPDAEADRARSTFPQVPPGAGRSGDERLGSQGWLGDAIDEAVESGRFKSRQEAITHALEAMFVQKERNVVT